MCSPSTGQDCPVIGSSTVMAWSLSKPLRFGRQVQAVKTGPTMNGVVARGFAGPDAHACIDCATILAHVATVDSGLDVPVDPMMMEADQDSRLPYDPSARRQREDDNLANWDGGDMIPLRAQEATTGGLDPMICEVAAEPGLAHSNSKVAEIVAAGPFASAAHDNGLVDVPLLVGSPGTLDRIGCRTDPPVDHVIAQLEAKVAHCAADNTTETQSPCATADHAGHQAQREALQEVEEPEFQACAPGAECLDEKTGHILGERSTRRRCISEIPGGFYDYTVTLAV
ncbi:unnamed protein product [Urochloa humidicola]